MARPAPIGIVLGLTLSMIGPGNVSHAEVTANSMAADLEQCVEPTDFMRKNHMEVLLHQRDQIVHQGMRTTQQSLTQCVSCHAAKDADGKYLPVNAEGQFCQGCHAVVAVDMDCFQCHATRPEITTRTDGLAMLAMNKRSCMRRSGHGS